MEYVRNAFLSFTGFIFGSFLISQREDYSFFGKWTITSPANAWSSMWYAFPIAPICVKFPLITLSVVSFGLWSNQTVAINFIDVTCIYWVIVVVSLSALPGTVYKWPVIYLINLCLVLFMGLSVHYDLDDAILQYYHDNLLPITGVILMFSAAMLSSFYLFNRIFIIGSSLIMIGFGCKLMVIFNGVYAGTAIFHTLTAIGIGVLSLLNETPESGDIRQRIYGYMNQGKRKTSRSTELTNLLGDVEQNNSETERV